MATPLEEVAEAAEEVVRDEREVARRARQMQRKRDRGWSWRRILDDNPHQDWSNSCVAAPADVPTRRRR